MLCRRHVSSWRTFRIGTFEIILAIAGTLRAWLRGKLDDRLGPERVIAGSIVILLFSIAAILLVDKDSIFFIKVAPPEPGAALFSGAAERAYLVLGCLIGAAGGPLQAASRTLLIRLAPKDRIAQYFGLFALTGKVTSFIRPAADRRDHRSDREPEGRHGGAGGVLCGGIGAAGAGEGLAAVVPGHRAAMNPESRDDTARDSGFALTRAPE